MASGEACTKQEGGDPELDPFLKQESLGITSPPWGETTYISDKSCLWSELSRALQGALSNV